MVNLRLQIDIGISKKNCKLYNYYMGMTLCVEERDKNCSVKNNM